MRIVVDSNIVFSAILKLQSKISRTLTTSKNYFEFFSVNLLKDEINEHQVKLLNITKYTPEELLEVTELITRKIHFINDSLIPPKILMQAENILTGVDLDDTEFLALSIHLNAKLWTGDKKLISGLKRKGFENITITTEEIFRLFTEQ